MHEAKSTEVQAWLKRASADLRAAEIDLDAHPPLIEDALFHCQQAVEKSLKAFLTAGDTPFPKTHDLDELGRMCIELDRSLETVVRPAIYLTVFAWEFRYPGESEVPPLASISTDPPKGGDLRGVEAREPLSRSILMTGC